MDRGPRCPRCIGDASGWDPGYVWLRFGRIRTHPPKKDPQYSHSVSSRIYTDKEYVHVHVNVAPIRVVPCFASGPCTSPPCVPVLQGDAGHPSDKPFVEFRPPVILPEALRGTFQGQNAVLVFP